MSQSQQHVLQRKIGLFSATNLVMANMVDTGIFTTSGFIMGKPFGTVPNFFWITQARVPGGK